MQKYTRSILTELSQMPIKSNDKTHLVESRASNIIQSAINLMEQFNVLYTPEQADDLKRKFINAIRHQDPKKFYRSVRRKEDEDQGTG
jgi:hypothetical protein